ncbi:MAG: transposase [Anaerolineaceae bacterium]|nr:transposase [Anaerolineaceae bacterium]
MIVHQNVAGLDVHKKVVVTAIIVQKADGSLLQTRCSFGTMTKDLLDLSDWLMTHNVTHVTMESTGEYWKPVLNMLENYFEVIVVNAQHLSKVPGRKTCRSYRVSDNI